MTTQKIAHYITAYSLPPTMPNLLCALSLPLLWITLLLVGGCQAFVAVSPSTLSAASSSRWRSSSSSGGCRQHQHQQHSILMLLASNRRARRLIPCGTGGMIQVIRARSSLFSSDDSDSDASSSPAAATTTTTSKPQRVSIVGAGAVGSYYGARLWEAGHKVTFYMRGDHLRVSRQKGLRVTSVAGDLHISADQLDTATATWCTTTGDDTTAVDDIGVVAQDWVIVALKSSSLQAIPDLIYPLLSPQTRVLVIMNGLVEDDLIHMLKEKAGETDNDETAAAVGAPLQCCRALYGGMALICSNRLEPGHVDHSFAGLLAAGVACTRTLSADTPAVDQAAFEELFGTSKVPITYEPCLLRGRWKKMVWNLPFNGISVAMGGITVDKIVLDADLRELANTVMDETIAVGNTALEERYGRNNFEALGDAEKKQMMNLSDNMGPYKTSTMIDLTERRSMEVEYMFGKAVERAHELGVPVPHLETLVAQINAFQRFYKLF